MSSSPPQARQVMPGFIRIARYFSPLIRREHRLIAGATLAFIAEIGLRLLEPWPLKYVFDAVIAPKGGSSSAPLGMDLEPAALIGLAALALVTLTTLRSLAAYAGTVGFALVGNRVLTEIRLRLYRHLQSLSLSFHAKARGGELTVRMIGDVGRLQDATSTALLPLLIDGALLTGMFAVMFWMQWQLALLSLAILPLLWLTAQKLTRRIRQVARKQRRREGDMAATAAESIGAIKTVQALSLEGAFDRVFARHSAADQKEGVRGKRLEARLERTVDILLAISTALILWQGARLVARGSLSPGELIVFLAYLKSAFKPARDFAKYTGRLAKATAAGERVIELLERVPDVRNRPDAVVAPELRGDVRFAGAGFEYESGQRVLDGVDLTIEAGQRLALVGSSGSGKSTLVSLLPRLYDPVRGSVLVDGRDIREFTIESLRARISVVLQDTLLFTGTIGENIAYGARSASADEIVAAARLANAHEFIAAMPLGYDTMVGERGVTLSVGQRQRIAIARAAVRDAPILILDEPTTGLDRESQRLVIAALARLARGRTTILVTHDLDFAARSDCIAYLEAGRIVELGTHAALMQANGCYAAMYRQYEPALAKSTHLEEPYAYAG